MLNFRIFTLFLILLVIGNLNAQTPFVSTKNFNEHLKKIKANPEEALPTTLTILKKSTKSGAENQEIAEAAYLTGFNFYLLGNYALSSKHLEKSLSLPGLASLQTSQAYNYLGVCYEYMGKPTLSIESYLNALRISESLFNKEEMARNMINLGLAYGKINNFELAESYLKRSYNYSLELKDTLKIGLYFQNMGLIFYNKSNFDSSLFYNREAIKTFEKVNYKSGIFQCLFNIALIKEDRFQYYEAIQSHQSILQVADTIYDKVTIANSLLMIGRAYANLQKMEEALRFTDSAEKLIKQGDLLFLEEQIAINRLHLSKNDPLSFSRNLAYYINIKETQQSNEMNEKIAEMQALFDYESKEREVEKAQAALKSANIRNWIVILGVLITAILTIIALIATKKLGQIRRILFLKNKEISTLIPKPEEFRKSLETKEEDIHTRLFKDILKLIENREHILNPELSLKDIAKKLASNELYISQAINKLAGKNFNRFLNEYRIEEARNLLTNPKNKGKNMEEIAQMSGFTNANTFFRQFKEQTGLTPTQFKNMNKE